MPGSHFKDSVLFLAWKQQAWQWCEQVIRYWKASNFESLVHITCYFHAKNRTESLQWLPTSRHIQRKYVLPSTILLWSPAASVLQQLHHKPRRNALKSKTCTISWKNKKYFRFPAAHFEKFEQNPPFFYENSLSKALWLSDGVSSMPVPVHGWCGFTWKGGRFKWNYQQNIQGSNFQDSLLWLLGFLETFVPLWLFRDFKNSNSFKILCLMVFRIFKFSEIFNIYLEFTKLWGKGAVSKSLLLASDFWSYRSP